MTRSHGGSSLPEIKFVTVCCMESGAGYEQVYQERVVHNFHRRAKQMGFTLWETSENTAVGVS